MNINKENVTEVIKEVLDSDESSYLFKSTLKSFLSIDPVDAANEVEVLRAILLAKLER